MLPGADRTQVFKWNHQTATTGNQKISSAGNLVKRRALFEHQYTHIGFIRNAARASTGPTRSQAVQHLPLALLSSNTSVGSWPIWNQCFVRIQVIVLNYDRKQRSRSRRDEGFA